MCSFMIPLCYLQSAIKRQGAWLLLDPQDRYELTSGDSVRLGAVDCQIHFAVGGAENMVRNMNLQIIMVVPACCPDCRY